MRGAVQPVREATCQHCASTIRTKRPDLRKWCDRCGALRDIINLRSKVHKCLGCGEVFYAINSRSARARQKLCPDCTGTPVGEARDTDPCVFCNRRDRLIPTVALCYLCASQAADEKTATQVVRAVVRKLKEVRRAP